MASSLTDKFKGGLAGIAAALSIGAVARGSVELVNQFSEVQDATAAAGVVFGKSMDTIITQAAGAGEQLGMTQAQVIDAANMFGTYGKAAGLTGKELAGFSTELTTLAGDLSSFKGGSPEEAIEAIGSALRGEAEPARKYGVMLDDMTLKNQALKMGLISTTKDALTPQQKILAAHKVILAQTTDAQGDFLREQDSAANVQKRLSAATTNLAAQVGGILEPAFTRGRLAVLNMLTPISGFLTRVQKAQELMAGGAVTGDVAKALGLGPGLTAAIDTALQSWNVFVNTIKGGWTEQDGVSGIPAFFEAIAVAINRVRAMDINWGVILGGAGLLGIIGLVQKLGGPLVMLGGLIGRFAPLLSTMGGALRFLLGPVGIIGGLLIAAYSSSEQFRTAVSGLLPMVTGLATQLLGTLVPVVSNLATTLMPILVSVFSQVAPLLGNILAALVPVVGQLLGALVPVLTTLISAVLPPFAQLLGAVVPILGSLLGAVMPIIPPVAQLIGVLGTLIAAVLRPLMPLVSAVAQLLSAVLGGALSALMPIVERVLGTFSGFVGWVASNLQPLIENVAGAFRGLGDVIGGVVNGIRDFQSNPLGGVQDWLGIPHAGGGVVGLAGGGTLAAAGGALAGYAPGRDTVPAMLSRGESVLVPELTRAIGPQAIQAANWAASHRKGASGTTSAGAGADPVSVLTGGAGGSVTVMVDARGASGVDVAQIKAVVRTAVREAQAEQARRRYRG